MSGLKTLYNLLLKDAVKRSGQASGIMSIGDSVRKLAKKKFEAYVATAQKQGVDLDKLSEQELRYIIELNKPQKPKIISADSPEGKGITEALLGKRGQVIEGNFGKPFAKEAENKKNIAAMKKRKMIEDAVDNASPGFVKGDRKYNAQLVAEDLADKKFGKEFYDLDQKQQMDLYGEALDGLSVDLDDFAQGGRAGFSNGGIDVLKLEDEAMQRALNAFKYFVYTCFGLVLLRSSIKGPIPNLYPARPPVAKSSGSGIPLVCSDNPSSASS